MTKTHGAAILFLILLATGCVQPATTMPGSDWEPPLPAQSYPMLILSATPGAYPPAAIEPDAGVPYPAIQNDGELSWIQAEALIYAGQVVKVLQTHDGQAWLTLKDGRRLHTLQPQMDLILQVIKTCGDPCKDIRIATE